MPISRHLACVLGLFLSLAVGAPPPAHGQTAPGSKPAPQLAYVYPAGAGQGTRLTLHLGGQNLAEATAARFSGPGVTARITGYERPLTPKELNALREKIEVLQKQRAAAPDTFPAASARALSELRTTLARRGNRRASPSLAETLTLELTIAPDAPEGDRELRLLTAAGLSNPLVFQIGSLPEFSAPVVTPTQPAPGAQDRRPGGPPGATPPSECTVQLPTVVNGQILPGEIDRIRFTARRGQQIVASVSARALIPYLADAVPGWFQAAISLRDREGKELAYNDDFQFRPDPVLACTIPADGEYQLEIKDAIYRGREDFVYRIALGELPFVRSVFPLGVGRGQPAELELTGWNLPGNRLPIDARHHPAGTMRLSVRKDGHASNPVRFAVGDTPEVTETEPNETAGRPPLATPLVVNGRIDRPGDRDVFGFAGKKGERFVAEVVARRLDSSLDSMLVLRDASGAVLATNDDCEDKAEGLLTHQADSRISATLPVDGTYFLTITDTQHRGGPEFGYRLMAGPARPDFSLRVTPSAVNVAAGASVPITVFAVRHDGFAGEIALGLHENTAGFRLSGARIPAGKDAVRLTLTAPTGPPAETQVLHLAGLATIENQPVVRQAVAADDTMQAFLYRHLVPARTWEVTTTGRGLPLRVSSALPLRLSPDKPTVLKIATPGLPRTTENVKATLLDPPPGISIGACKAYPGYLELSVLLDPATPQPEPAGNLIVAIVGDRPNRKGQAPRATGGQLGIAPAIPFEVPGFASPP